jgi:hypothetical protein
MQSNVFPPKALLSTREAQGRGAAQSQLYEYVDRGSARSGIQPRLRPKAYLVGGNRVTPRGVDDSPALERYAQRSSLMWWIHCKVQRPSPLPRWRE